MSQENRFCTDILYLPGCLHHMPIYFRARDQFQPDLMSKEILFLYELCELFSANHSTQRLCRCYKIYLKVVEGASLK